MSAYLIANIQIIDPDEHQYKGCQILIAADYF